VGDDAETQEYVKIGSYGMKSKAYLDMQGDSIIDDEIGNTPSTTHAPSAKAVADYVNEHGGGTGDLPISEEQTSDASEEQVWSNNAETQTYAKIGSYGMKSKAYLDLNGNNVIPIKDSAIGNNPSTTNVPTTKAVKDYVDAHGGGGTSTIRLLFIGSSFGVDTVSEVGKIVQSIGGKIIIGNAYIGAATLSTFISRYNNHQGMAYYKWFENATSWSLYDMVNGEWLPNQGTGVSDEDRVQAMNNTTLDFLLQDEPWDYIILQNGAYQSPYPDQSPFWTKDGGGNITRNIVQELVAICKKNCIYTNPVFGMNMTWAFSVYHTISDGHLNDDFWVSYGENQGARQLGMYNNIATNYADCLTNCEDVKFIVPSGTSIQNARLNSTLRNSTNYTEVSGGMPTIAEAEAITSLDNIAQTYPFMDNDKNWKNKNDFTRDTIHAGFILTRFLLGATLYQKILAKRYGVDISESTYRQNCTPSGDTREQLATPVTDENFPTLVSIVKASIANPFTINNNQ
jgi:hypothetical protein